ncbi:hypothetical protein ACFLYL_00300 [Chloroflexota bacterium]
MITQDEAIAIARKALKGKVKTEEDAPVEVEPAGNRYIIRFRRLLPLGVRGSDIAAEVIVGARSGRVFRVLAGAD